MPDPLTVAALKAAEALASELVKAGARRVRREILGTLAERGMRDVYTRAIAGLLLEVGETMEESGGVPDPEAMKVAETVLEGMCSDDEAAGLLLNLTLRPGPVPVEALRERATALSYDPDTLPFPFDGAMRVLTDKLWVEFLAEAGKERSRIQPVVNEGLLAAVRSLHRMAVSGGVGAEYSEIAPSLPDADELEGARRKLEGLPLEEVPDDRAVLPPRSVMPLRPNPNFVGRREDLKRIAANLKAGGTAAIGEVTVAASSGLGGVGKTQLACEFVYRYGRYFHGVYWLNFVDPASIPAQVASCGGAGGMNLRPRDYHELPLEERVQAVKAEWQGELPRLLVFDNCEDDGLLDRWLPLTGGCRVLVTSRRGSWDPSLGATDLKLGVFDRRESVALLREYRPDLPPDDPELDAIAEELGDLPLALDLAGRYLKRYARDVPCGYPPTRSLGASVSQASKGNLSHEARHGRLAHLRPKLLAPQRRGRDRRHRAKDSRLCRAPGAGRAHARGAPHVVARPVRRTRHRTAVAGDEGPRRVGEAHGGRPARRGRGRGFRDAQARGGLRASGDKRRRGPGCRGSGVLARRPGGVLRRPSRKAGGPAAARQALGRRGDGAGGRPGGQPLHGGGRRPRSARRLRRGATLRAEGGGHNRGPARAQRPPHLTKAQQRGHAAQE